MAYHPKNIPPKHIQKLMNSTMDIEDDELVIFDSEKYQLVQKDFCYALFDKKCTRYEYRDKYIEIRNCDKKVAIKIAESLPCA